MLPNGQSMKFTSLYIYTFLFLNLTFSFIGCKTPNEPLDKNLPILEGRWRATLKLNEFEELPFNFDLQYANKTYTMTIMNGKERIPVKDFTFDGDSVFIKLPVYNSEFRGKFNQRRILGVWNNYSSKTDRQVPFYAVYGDSSRFVVNIIDSIPNVNGRWEVSFISADKTSRSDAIGEFRQDGEHLEATFLTPTGDYRYLEGRVGNKDVMLSSFDGAHAYLFMATIDEFGDLNGDFYSGESGHDIWLGFRNDTISLPNAETQTQLKDPSKRKINFTFSDLEGKNVSLSDPMFQNKVVIVQIMGTWCPNCMDETRFLTDLYKKYHSQGLEIVALAFETSNELATARPQLMHFKKSMGVEYPILLAGKNSKEEASKTLDMLKEVKAFPTMLVIDRQGFVRKTHTGFSGPATSEYKRFVMGFSGNIEGLLNEKGQPNS